jgi:hypothetical protein
MIGEKMKEKCPYCAGDLNSYADYPKLIVGKLSMVKIPDFIMSHREGFFWQYEIEPLKGIRRLARTLLPRGETDNPHFPREIIDRMRANGLRELVVGQDKYLRYARKDRSQFFQRYKNRAGFVNEVMQNTAVLDLFGRLRCLEGREISREDLMPWKSVDSSWGYVVPGLDHKVCIQLQDGVSQGLDEERNHIGFIFRSDIRSEEEGSSCALTLPVAILDYVGKGNKN